MAAEMSDAFKATGLRFPRVLTLAITDDCNLFCSHCWVEASPRVEPTMVASLTVRRLIEEFVELGGEGIRLTGGEPLLHPDWLDILQFSVSLGLASVEIQTNALLLGTVEIEALEKFATRGLKLQISLDGALPASHDLVRGAGTFSRTLTTIRRLVSAGLGERTSLLFTEMKHNLSEFPELLELAEELGIKSVISGTLVAGGRAAAGGVKISPPDPDQYLDLLEHYLANARFQELYAAYGTMAALEWWLTETPEHPCCNLVENPYVTPGGLLFPCLLCHSHDFAVAGVFDRALSEVFSEGADRWSSLQRLARRRAETIPACRTCPDKPICSGGCVGRAWGSCGDLLAVDDRCEIRRSIGMKKRLHIK